MEEIKETGIKEDRKLNKIIMEKLRGRVIIFDHEKSEFAKNLHLNKNGDYIQKK
ncbi:MAG: hypothetical protein QXI33_02100 [Candidatus Pacearchaeota archaeon]